MSDNKGDPLKNNSIYLETFKDTVALPEFGGPPLTAENLKLLGEPVKPVVPVEEPVNVPIKSQAEMEKLVDEQNKKLLEQVKEDLASASASAIPSASASTQSVQASVPSPEKPVVPVGKSDKVPIKSQAEIEKLVDKQNKLLLKQVKEDLASASASATPSASALTQSAKASVPSVPSSEKPFVPVTTGGAQQSIDPLTSFLLNMMFIVLFYYVATKIFTFYGVGTEVYGTYFTFYLFLYLTTMILPTEYPKIK
jgi:hypothetical protein